MSESWFGRALESAMRDYTQGIRAQFLRDYQAWNGGRMPPTRPLNMWHPWWPWRVGADLRTRWRFWRRRTADAWSVLRDGMPEA